MPCRSRARSSRSSRPATTSSRPPARAAKTYELTDFLVNVLKATTVPGGAVRATVTYHDSCSGLREMGVKTQPRALLERLPGVKLDQMADATR